MASFIVDISIMTSRIIGNEYNLKVRRVIDVDNDTNLDEILDIPIGKLILGSGYQPKNQEE